MKFSYATLWTIIVFCLMTPHKTYAYFESEDSQWETAVSTYNYARLSISHITANKLYKEALNAFENIYEYNDLEKSSKIDILNYIIRCLTTLNERFFYSRESDILHYMNELIKLSDTPEESVRAYLFCSKICAEFNDIIQAYKFYKLANDIKTQNRLSGNEFDIAFLETLGIIEIRNGREHKGIRHLTHASKLARASYGKESEEYLFRLLDISQEYSKISNYSKSSRYHTSAHKPYIESVRKQFSQSTDIQRARYWNSACQYFAKTNEISYKFAEGLSFRRGISGTAYDCNLLSKGILLTTSKDYENYISNQKDSTVAILAEMMKSSLSNKDSLNSLITQRLDNLGIPYTSPHLDLSWKDVRRSLNSDDLAIEFFNVNGNYGALMLKKHWPAPKCAILGRITFPEDFSKMSRDERWTLSQVVWPSTILRHFPRKENAKVFFAPDAEMHLLGIEYLPLFYETSDTLYNSISDYFNINRLTSTRDIVLMDINDNEIESASLYGAADFNISNNKLEQTLREIKDKEISSIILKDYEYESKLQNTNYTTYSINPLPNSLYEINQIEKHLRTQHIAPMVLTGKYFNEYLFKKTSISKHLLHIATHGFYIPTSESGDYPADPMDRNALIMSGGPATIWFTHKYGPNDGVLTANEAATLDLSSTKLIVMSSCESGIGALDTDGVFGLQRGFKKAGVQSIIMSLWKVDDEACFLLFDNFYKRLLNDNMSIREAFTFAQRALRDDPRFTSPYYWAAFILVD